MSPQRRERRPEVSGVYVHTGWCTSEQWRHVCEADAASSASPPPPLLLSMLTSEQQRTEYFAAV